MRHRIAVIGALALAMAGCAGTGGSQEPTTTPTSSGTEQPTDSPTPGPSPGQAEIAWSGPELLEGDSTVPLAAAAVAGPEGFVSQRSRLGVWEEGPTTALFFSPDGESWEQTFELASLEINAVVAGGPGYVAVGSRYLPTGFADLNRAPWAAASADGQSWEPVDVVLPDLATQGEAGAASVPVAVGGPVFVPATAEISISGSWLSDVVVTADGLVALGHSQQAGRSNILWTSSDGTEWTALDEDPFGSDMSVVGLVAGADRYVAYGHRQTEGDFAGAIVAWHSDDAVTWEPATGDEAFEDEFGGGPFIAGVVAFGDGFVMVGGGWVNPPMAWTSADGSAWAASATLPSLTETSAEIHAVAASPGLIVATGREVTTEADPASQFPGIWTSSDGADWSQVSAEELRGDLTQAGISVDSVAVLDGEWFALGKVWDYPDEVTSSVAWRGR